MPNGHENGDEKLSLCLDLEIKIMLIIPYIGVVFSFMGSLSFLFLGEFEGNAKISCRCQLRLYSTCQPVSQRILEIQSFLMLESQGLNPLQLGLRHI